MVQLVGILNITPDSFSDGGKYTNPSKAIQHTTKLFNDGADLVDLGAESTNPWSSPLSPEIEWQRLEPVLKSLIGKYPNKLSVDTYHAEVAQKALQMGVSIINDVTMFQDPAMVKVVVSYADRVRCIVSHLSPDTNSVAKAHKLTPTKTVEEVKSQLLSARKKLIDKGIPAKNIILDPGIGFGKSSANNWQLNWDLLRFAEQVPGIDVMIGYSRKRFLGVKRMELEPNLKAARIAIESGAKYLRVHDVADHAKFLKSL